MQCESLRPPTLGGGSMVSLHQFLTRMLTGESSSSGADDDAKGYTTALLHSRAQPRDGPLPIAATNSATKIETSGGGLKSGSGRLNQQRRQARTVIPPSLREPDMVVWWWVRDYGGEMMVVVVEGEEGDKESRLATFMCSFNRIHSFI